MDIVTYKQDKVNDFRPHADGSGSFSSFAISAQLRKPLVRAGYNVIGIARGLVVPSDDERDGHYRDKFSIDNSQKTILFKPRGGPRAPRAVAVVQNTAKNAAALEFGSGDESVGTPGIKRPQGGWNNMKRPLGRAGGKVGDWHE